PLRVFAARGRRLAGTQLDLELHTRDVQLVVGQQGGPADALVVHAGAVGAAEIADQQKTVRLDDDAVQLGYALVVEVEVAIFLAADKNEILDDLNRFTAVERNQLGSHVRLVENVSPTDCILLTLFGTKTLRQHFAFLTLVHISGW